MAKQKTKHGNAGNRYAAKDPVDLLHVVSFRATHTDHEFWKRQAEANGQSFGEWANDQLNRNIRQPTLFERRR